MPAPELGTPEFDALVAETGGGALLPGFDYEAHVAATSVEHISPEVISDAIPTSAVPIDDEIVLLGVPIDEDSPNGTRPGPLVNPAMPARGTAEFIQLAIDTGGGSLLAGFNYQAHINALGESYDPVLGMELYEFIPPSKMPEIGTEDWFLLSKETGGGSELANFNYEAHLYATRGSDAAGILMHGDDSLQGGKNDETFYGYGGNDLIDGGQGVDTAIFSGTLSEYSFSFDSADGGKLIVSDQIEARDGADKLTGIEMVKIGGDKFDIEEIRMLALQNVGSKTIPQVKRLYNKISGNHLFSSDQTEVDYLTGGSLGWINEGNAYKNSNAGNQSVYRFSVNGSHFYTANEAEKNHLISSNEFSNFVYEGEAHKVFSVDSPHDSLSNLSPVRRFYNHQTNSHLFSSSLEEQAILLANPFLVDEGIAWYCEPIF